MFLTRYLDDDDFDSSSSNNNNNNIHCTYLQRCLTKDIDCTKNTRQR